jgi:hypothetical protein
MSRSAGLAATALSLTLLAGCGTAAPAAPGSGVTAAPGGTPPGGYHPSA